MGDFPYLDWLTRAYKERAGETGDDVHYKQAVGLANGCLVGDPTEERHRRVYEVESQWYGGKHPLTFSEYQQMSDRHKQRLKELREDVKRDYDRIAAEIEGLNIEHLYREETLNHASGFALNVFDMNKKSGDHIISFFCEVVNSSRELLCNSDLPAPCPFAVIGLGQMARGEATLYSKLEYAYIVESDTDIEYFRKLDVEISFRIANLCETPLCAYKIRELYGVSDSEISNISNVRGKQQAVLDRLQTVGFRIDSIEPQGTQGTTPMGRIVLTVPGMIQCYKQCLQSETKYSDSNLSRVFSSSVLIYSSAEGQKLYEQFANNLSDIESSKPAPMPQVKIRRHKALAQFIEDHSNMLVIPTIDLVVLEDSTPNIDNSVLNYEI